MVYLTMLHLSRLGVCVVLWCLAAGSLGVDAAPAGTRVLAVEEGKVSVFAQSYGDGVIRLTLQPDNDPSFYLVPHVIVAEARDAAALTVSCEGAGGGRCTITDSSECAVVVERVKAAENAERSATAAAVDVTFDYRCGDSSLITGTIFTSLSPKANVRFAFPVAKTLYGLAEHAADLPLRQGPSYEMWNTDAFQYKVNSTKGLYGSIPFIMAYAAKATTGVLFLNSADTTVRLDAEQSGAAPACDWTAEVGPVDLFLLPGPTPAKVQQQHAHLTGPTVLPPYFSLGYHQCRWNYLSTKDSLSIDEGFDKHNMPYDVLWLDIEHTEKKKYFTWDKYNFPDPKVLTDALASKGRKLVTVKDPHVKTEEGYHVFEEGKKGNYFVQQPHGGDYVGDCWPGKSSWPDFLNTRTREWYAGLFHDSRYPSGSRDIHTWVDMNEPSVFQTPRNTMPKELIHIDDAGNRVEHRYLHNAYSLLSTMAVYKGALEAGGPAAKPERPFVLTRSFFPGSQRYAAMWNGDNMANWEHLQNTQPELLSLSISNFPFCGCDIGGFFFEPEEELFVRWFQAGVFYPFFRGHAHLETKRREPWTFSVNAQDHLRNALALRYALIPYLYTQFYHAHRAGDIIMRPLFYEFPGQEELREEQDTFMFGPSLLAAPVVHKGATSKRVVFPKGSVWYRYDTGEAIQGTGAAGVPVPVQLDTIPLFLRGGHIVPVKLRLRRSTVAARVDPFTLLVALTAQGNSHGDLYLDDGTTFDYQGGGFAHRQFSFSQHTLRCSAASIADGEASSEVKGPNAGAFVAPNMVERVVILGLAGNVESVVVTSATPTNADGTPSEGRLVRTVEFDRVGNLIVVRKPDVFVGQDWEMSFYFE